MDRCPASQSLGAEAFLDAYLAQLGGDGWPSEGSRAQQSAWYVRAKAIADGERGKLEKSAERARKTLGDNSVPTQ